MAFIIGNKTVIHDADPLAPIVANSNVDVLQINGTDVLTHSGGTITLQNVNIADGVEVSINTDNLTEGTTNLFYDDALVDARITLQTGANLDLSSKTTTHLSEGTNLYYTAARWDSKLASADTSDLSEGSNLYYTDARSRSAISVSGDLAYNSTTGVISFSATTAPVVSVNSATGSVVLDTDDIAEGSTNLYYTDAQVNTLLGTKSYATETYVDTAETDAISTASSDATSKANAAQLAAINAAATDATSKANAAQLAAINAAATDATTKANQALVDAKAYADTAEADAVSAATATASADATTKANQALVDAKAYADTAEADAVTTANAYTDAEISAIVDGAPGTLDTLNELAAALGDDANLSTTLSTQIGTKVSKSGDTMTGTLTLSGAPSSANHAATKAYVDSAVTGGTGALDTDDITEAGNLYYTDARAQAVSINNLVEDTTPQLGGNLDLQTYDITTSSDDFSITTGSGSNLTTIEMGGFTEATVNGGGLAITSSTNQGQDVCLLGDIDFLSGGLITGEIIGLWAFDNATNLSSNTGLGQVLLNGTVEMVGCTLSDSASVIFGNLGTANEVGLAVGTSADARIHQIDSSGNTIFKLPAADGSANQVLKTDGNGDLSWVAQTSNTNTTYTAGTGLNLVGTEFQNTAPDQTVSLTGSGATSISGTYPNFTISSTDTNTDTNTTYTAGTNVAIDGSNVISSTDTNTTYTAGNGLTLTGTEFTMSGSYTGDFTATGDVTAYSDQRLKRNVETITNAVDVVNCLRGVNFEKDGRHSTGVIAQEIEEFFPEVVHTDADGMKSVAYGNISGLLIEAIKEQQKTIEDMKKHIYDLQTLYMAQAKKEQERAEKNK